MKKLTTTFEDILKQTKLLDGIDAVVIAQQLKNASNRDKNELLNEFEEILQHDPSVTRRLMSEKIAEIRQRMEKSL